MRLILIGPPGVGKGTQAALLQEKTGAKPLATGDIFRHEIKTETDLGRLAKTYMDRGELVPDEVTIQMMRKYLAADDVRRKGFILDGFPRTVEQARALEQILEEAGMPIHLAVAIEVSADLVVDRLGGRMICSRCGEIYHRKTKMPRSAGVCDSCGGELTVRKDDQPETIIERLRVFKENTAPVVEYYAKQGTLLRVDGAQPPEEVMAAILEGVTVKAQ